jgi:hypothetical protein
MKHPSERKIARYKREGLPGSRQQFNERAYRKAWYRAGKQLKNRSKAK